MQEENRNISEEYQYAGTLASLENQAFVTVACGTTCAYLGDERNLREFLVADDAARWLRNAGHVALLLLVDDTLDPLNFRQLRVALNKDEALIEKWSGWCGKPISRIPDPWGCHESYSAHFQEALLERLHALHCYPTLVSTASLYTRGLYAPYVQSVLHRYDELMEFLTGQFDGCNPEALFHVICSHCGYIDETKIEKIDSTDVKYYCRRCEKSYSARIDEVEGKLNWKLDCAARWNLLKIDAEPFGKAYLDPQLGSFFIALETAKKFFDGRDVLPLRYGEVKMDKSVLNRLLTSLPADVMRYMLTSRPTTDITITPDHVLNVASRYQIEHDLPYLDCVKQLVPMWLLSPESLTDRQRQIVSRGINFTEHFLGRELSLQLPTREKLENIAHEGIKAIHNFLVNILNLRRSAEGSWEVFFEPGKQLIASLGENKRQIIADMRALVGESQGVPPLRLLFLLPLDYLEMLEYMLHLRMGNMHESPLLVGAE